MKQFWRQNGLLLLIIAVLLAVLISLGGALMGGTADPLSDLFSVVTTPIRSGVSAAAGWVEDLYGYLFRYDEMSAELEELRTRVAEMEQAARDGEDALRENRQLRRLLDLQAKHRDFVFENVRVTAPSTSNWQSTLTISKGSDFDIAAGDCVVTETGVLVGVVSTVGLNSSVVSTIINIDTDMGGMVARTYSAGVLEGDFTLMREGKLKLSYLPDGAQLVAGDEVLTSGRGGVYPSGLVVGRVEGVFTDPSGKTRYAVVQPEAELGSLIEVFVIKNFDIVE